MGASFYFSDLAYVPHAGFGDFARKAVPGLLATLRAARVRHVLSTWAAVIRTDHGRDGQGSLVSDDRRELLRPGTDVRSAGQSEMNS